VTVAVSSGSSSSSNCLLVQTEPTSTFDLNQVLDPVIDRLARDRRGGAYEIKCEVRWNPARRCLPELVIDAPRVVLLARDEARLDLRLVRRNPPASSPPPAIEPLIRVDKPPHVAHEAAKIPAAMAVNAAAAVIPGGDLFKRRRPCRWGWVGPGHRRIARKRSS
jgi:hypothetical protein